MLCYLLNQLLYYCKTQRHGSYQRKIYSLSAGQDISRFMETEIFAPFRRSHLPSLLLILTQLISVRPCTSHSCTLHVNITYSCLHSNISVCISNSKFRTSVSLAVHIAVSHALFPNPFLDLIKQIKFDEAKVQDTKSFFQVTAYS